MGKPVPDYMSGNLNKKIMPLGVVMDERICTGYEYAAFYNDFRKFLFLLLRIYFIGLFEYYI